MQSDLIDQSYQFNWAPEDLNESILLRDGYAVPFDAIIDATNVLEYASAQRVMFLMLYYSGCRISELDNMKVNGFVKNVLFWRVGKNQSGSRSVVLPESFILELRQHRNEHKVRGIQLFSITSASFKRRFDSHVRPLLGQRWLQRTGLHGRNGFTKEYELQLKGLRKTFATHLFYRTWKKLGDATAAIEFTSKYLKHSSKGMTTMHYLENYDVLHLDKFGRMSLDEIINYKNQQTLHIHTKKTDKRCYQS